MMGRQPGTRIQLGNFLKRASLLMLTAAFLTGFGSCHRTLEQACNQHFPRFEQDLAGISSRIGQGGRSLASVVDTSADEKWAIRSLEDTQTYIDLMHEDASLAPARKELSQVATQLVALHGYFQQKKGKQVSQTVDKIRKHSNKARDLACKR